MASTYSISSILQGTPVIVDPCLYDAKCNHCGDHLCFKVTLDCVKPQNPRKDITFHMLCCVSLPDFMEDIQSFEMLLSAHGLVETYNFGFKELPEK